MHMNISTAIMTISVGADKSLVSGKIFSGIFHAKFLCLFPCQSMFILVLWIEADDIMMRFDFIERLVLMEISICFLTFHCKGKRIAVYAIKVVFFTNDHMTIFIKDRFLRIFIMLKN